MLRVYSIMYMEKLWNPHPSYTPILRRVRSSRSSIHTATVVPDILEREIVVEDLQEEEEEDQQAVEQQVIQVEIIEEEPEAAVFENEGYTLEPVEIQVLSEEEESAEEITRVDSKVSAEQEEVDVNSSIKEEEELNLHIATSISSSSSIVPPSTPPSIHTSITQEKTSAPTSPRTTSLLRRETNKFNDRRKSLTKKLRKLALNSNNNKRTSV